ncbi:MAG: TPM domain-containing protein [Deltaproteobacteria bacterium]|nr:TPM domain-containing protein [Deltaproteobacteria bacterium]
MKIYKDALNFLSGEQRKGVEDAIAKAESMTSGEIRVLIVAASSVLPLFNRKDRKIALRRRAEREFAKLGIHNTRDRTGVLIMVSIEERMVQVLAGSGINSVVPENTWPSMVRCIVEGIKSGDPAGGISAAVAGIGKVLSEHFPVKPDDTNELSNEVVFKGRW